MPKFHLITEKLSKNIRLKILSKNTAAFSIRISKISRENNVKRCPLSRFFAFLINAVVLFLATSCLQSPHFTHKLYFRSSLSNFPFSTFLPIYTSHRDTQIFISTLFENSYYLALKLVLPNYFHGLSSTILCPSQASVYS